MRKYLLFSLILHFNFILVCQNIELDVSFGDSGIVTTPNTTEIRNTCILEDGNIISVGYYLEENGIYHQVIAKYHENGEPDNNFGINGVIKDSIGTTDSGYLIEELPENKFLIVGYCMFGNYTEPAGGSGYLIRYNNDGTKDTSFGDNGKMFFDTLSSGESFTITSILLLPDNKILIGGSMSLGNLILIKLKSDGSLDNDFGENGYLVLDDSYGVFSMYDMKVVDDRLILAGADYTIQDSSKSVILKIDFNGNFDDRFGVNGKYLVDVHEFDDPWPFSGEFFYRIQTDEDNNLFVAGKSFLYDYILKLNMDGTPDLSFGSNGFKYHNYPNNDFVISNDGTFLLHGGGFSLTRLNQNGDLDTTFGTNGTFIINISEETNYSHCINIQDDEKIILSGTSRKNDDPNFTLARLIIEPFVQEVDIVNNSNDIIVYPNPFSERIIIKSSQEFISDVFVYDIYGKLRVNSKVNKKETNLALNLPEGMYSCVIYTHNGKHFIKKIIALKK